MVKQALLESDQNGKIQLYKKASYICYWSVLLSAFIILTGCFCPVGPDQNFYSQGSNCKRQ